VTTAVTLTAGDSDPDPDQEKRGDTSGDTRWDPEPMQSRPGDNLEIAGDTSGDMRMDGPDPDEIG
jgi:hypothetical protein